MKNLLLTFLMISTSLLSQTMHTINAGNYYFTPEALTIEQGDSVEFINDNGFHDVVITSGPEMLTLPACSGPCDIGVLVFNTPGEYEYICSIGSHSSLGMVGTITVNETDEIFRPQTNEELQAAVDLWVSDNATAISTYGEINNWDVSLITNMSQLFQNKTTFNEDISEWDVSNVRDMSRMFNNAESFNQDISEWDVSSVTDMHNMYDSAYNFNQDISGWDVSSVSDMNNMFYYAESFNQDISGWDVSNVTNFYAMFDSINDLSDSNKCAIHTLFDSNENWPYDWEEYCSDE